MKRGVIRACLAVVLCGTSLFFSTDLATAARRSDTQVMCSMDSFCGWCRGHHLSSHITSGESIAEAANDLPSELRVRHWCWC